MCGGTRAAFAIRRTPLLARCRMAYGIEYYEVWNMKNGTWRLKSARPQVIPAPPIPPTPARPRLPSDGRERKQTSKMHPSAAPGPFWPKGFPSLCSLSVVICVFFRIQNRKTTRKSPRTARTNGGNLLAKTGLALERGAICEGLFVSFVAPGHRTAPV